MSAHTNENTGKYCLRRLSLAPFSLTPEMLLGTQTKVDKTDPGQFPTPETPGFLGTPGFQGVTASSLLGTQVPSSSVTASSLLGSTPFMSPSVSSTSLLPHTMSRTPSVTASQLLGPSATPSVSASQLLGSSTPSISASQLLGPSPTASVSASQLLGPSATPSVSASQLLGTFTTDSASTILLPANSLSTLTPYKGQDRRPPSTYEPSAKRQKIDDYNEDEEKEKSTPTKPEDRFLALKKIRTPKKDIICVNRSMLEDRVKELRALTYLI